MNDEPTLPASGPRLDNDVGSDHGLACASWSNDKTTWVLRELLIEFSDEVGLV